MLSFSRPTAEYTSSYVLLMKRLVGLFCFVSFHSSKSYNSDYSAPGRQLGLNPLEDHSGPRCQSVHQVVSLFSLFVTKTYWNLLVSWKRLWLNQPHYCLHTFIFICCLFCFVFCFILPVPPAANIKPPTPERFGITQGQRIKMQWSNDQLWQLLLRTGSFLIQNGQQPLLVVSYSVGQVAKRSCQWWVLSSCSSFMVTGVMAPPAGGWCSHRQLHTVTSFRPFWSPPVIWSSVSEHICGLTLWTRRQLNAQPSGDKTKTCVRGGCSTERNTKGLFRQRD